MNCDTSAIIVCAGNSTRMCGVNKQLLSLGSSTVVGMSMSKLQRCPSVKEIIVVARVQDITTFKDISKELNISKLKDIVVGGSTRQESVSNGIESVSKDTKYITIHDGARPLVEVEDIEKSITDARTHGGATLGVPVKDTIKVVKDGFIVDTPNRETLYITQTPQTFDKSLYLKGLHYALQNDLNFTDDCQLMESIGCRVFMTVGKYSNIKITTPEDISVAENILKGSTKQCLE